MKNTNKNRGEKKKPSEENQTPVNLRSGDKLRENPSNDEETIAQDPRKSWRQQTDQSPLSRQHDGGINQVTNEDDQKEIVNPTSSEWDEPSTEPAPKRND